MIPTGNNLEDIQQRELIIRDFYRVWKEKNRNPPIKYPLHIQKERL